MDAATCVRLLAAAGREGGPSAELRTGPPGSEAAIRAAAARAARPCLEPATPEGQAAASLQTFLASERVSDRRAAVARAEADDFLVVDGVGRYVGVASRAAVLAPPRRVLVLVDHNEIGQAVPGAEEAEIVEVIDHHRLGTWETRQPIAFHVDVVGSTCTLVDERWRAAVGPPPLPIAGLLLAGILSDTLAFRSPTCTARDTQAAARLAPAAGVPDIAAFGEEVLAAGAGLGSRPPDEIVGEDYKEYAVAAGRLLIAQAEVRSLAEVAARRDDLEAALDRLRDKRGAGLAILMLTDVVRGQSRLLATGDARLVSRLPYPAQKDGTLDAGRVVSRKKELVPAVLAALE
jgi:manganese-dependent inorganic pyrophosphatase